MAIEPSIIVAGREPTEQSIDSDEQGWRDRHHDVSILIAVVGAVGLVRGVVPASNVSMITIDAPQHGQGRAMSGRLQVVVKKNRNAAVVLFIVGGCTPCSRWWSWNLRRSS
ncbi:MAG: hypothetical protein OEU93_17450, partial [Rubrivivax sp.]|nr:hypothetical protein [Rubrivivax sp.]